MGSRRSFLALASAVPMSSAALAQTALLPPISFSQLPDPSQPISFAWSGPLTGAAFQLAAQLRLAAWINMSSGLPLPDPPPFVPVSVGFSAASPAEIVESLNRAVSSKAVVILDFRERFVGVVYYG